MTFYEIPGGEEQIPTAAPPPMVRFAVLGESWDLIRENINAWMLAALLYLLVYLPLYALSFILADSLGRNAAGTAILRPFIIISLTLLPNTFLGAGQLRMALRNVREGNARLADLFSGGDVLGRMVLLHLLLDSVCMILLGTAGFLGKLGAILSGNTLLLSVCVTAGWIGYGYVVLRSYFAPILLVDSRLSVGRAIAVSWQTTRGSIALRLFAYLFVLALVCVLVTLFTCGIGLLVLAPLNYVSMALVYRDLFAGREHVPLSLSGVTLDMPLPPPSAYDAAGYREPPPPPA